MPAVSKRARKNRDLVAGGVERSFGDALDVLGQMKGTAFKNGESIDVAINLGVDIRQPEQQVRGFTVLPHGSGRKVRVAVFAQGDDVATAKEAGADKVGLEDLVEQIKAGKLDFDVVIASPDTMRIVGQSAQILGPRGLMPNPKNGTVTKKIAQAVSDAKRGQVQFRTDKGGIIHGCIGNTSFKREAIKDNLEALLSDLKKLKPSAAKGVYLKKITLSTTMGPGIVVDPGSLDAG